MMFRSSSSYSSLSIRRLARGACFGLALALAACGGESDGLSTDTGNPPVIIGQKLRVAASGSGVIVSGDPGAVTPGASVRVENVSRGRARVTTAAQDGSFEVELEGSADDEYRVEASLGGETTSAELPSGGGLAGREFLLESSEGFAPLDGTSVRMSFDQTQLNLHAGCNTMSASYTRCGGKLCASDLITTDIGCPPALHTQDEWLAAFVRSEPSLTQSGDRLTLAGTEATLEFRDREVVVPDRTLENTWIIDTVLEGDVASSVPVEANVQFTAGDEVFVNDSCNSISGTYAASGNVLTLSDMVTADRGCPEPNAPFAESIGQVLTNGTLEFEIEATRLTLRRGTVGLIANVSE